MSGSGAPPLAQRDVLSERLARGIVALDLSVPAPAQARLLDYLALLHHWNRAYNLTAVRDPAEMVVRHLLDSLAVLPWVEGPRVIDVGSGAGLPGMVLALADPTLDVTLLDAAAKRVRFLQEVLIRLAPANVAVVRARAEEYRPDRPFATVTCRAFAALPRFVESSAHLAAPGGLLLAMKGERADEEVASLAPAWRARAPAVTALEVPGLAAARYAVGLRVPS
jgi:16S rRNA (guanine527-N7)-methyltransferase